jgi:putative spermidine/putrescine transport system permease protein
MKSRQLLSIYHYLLVIFLLAPVFVVVLVSFTPHTYLKVPLSAFSLRWYRAILDHPEFISGFFNSLYLAITVSIISALLGTLGSFAIARYRFAGREFLNALLLSPLMVPMVVIGVGALQILSIFHVAGTFLGMVLAHVVITVPYMVRTMLASFAGFDHNLELAAMNLGANWVQTFQRITLPLVSPGLLAGTIFSFIVSFDDLTVALFVTGPKMVTLPIRIYAHIEYYTDPLVAAIASSIVGITIIVIMTIEKLVGLNKVLGSR